MPELNYYTLDVFTDEIFGGNPLAVIPEAPPLEDSLMQAIAREFNYPETVFVYPAEHAGALRKLRIFTPASELPFAGHPTIGTARLLAGLDMTPQTADGMSSFLLEEGIGLVPVTVNFEGDGLTWLTAPRLPEPLSVSIQNEALADILALKQEQIGIDGMPGPCAYTSGVPFTLIPLRDREALRACRLDIAAWRKVLADTAAPQVYVFCPGGRGNGIDYHVRMFAPGLGVPEDPATGAAAVAFAGYLWQATRQSGKWAIAQGEDMQRPSRIHVEIAAAGDALQTVRVGGSAVRVCEGILQLSHSVMSQRRSK